MAPAFTLDLERIRNLSQLDVAGRRVFLRADLDGAYSPQGAVRDDRPLFRLLPTLRYLVAQRAKVVVATRLSPSKREASRLATRGLAERLTELLGQPVQPLSPSFVPEIRGLVEGQIAVAPNLSIFPEEDAHDEGWALGIASAVDVYVLDGLKAALAGGTSVVELPRLLCELGVGSAIEPALTMYHDAIAAPAPEPYTLLAGGNSVRQVEALIRAVQSSCKTVLLGGAVANTFLVAQGWRPGASPHEPEQVGLAREALELAHAHGMVVHTPLDAVVRSSRADGGPSYETLALDRALLANEAVVDVGPETCAAYGTVLAQSATVLWVGLMGDCSTPETQVGSERIGQMAGLAPRAMAAGDETVDALRDFRLDQKFLIAAGGEAVISLLTGVAFPGLEALQR